MQISNCVSRPKPLVRKLQTRKVYELEVSESEELEVCEDYDDDDGHVENGVTADGDDDTVDAELEPSESDGDISDRHEVFYVGWRAKRRTANSRRKAQGFDEFSANANANPLNKRNSPRTES